MANQTYMAYCFKCREKKPIQNPERAINAAGRHQVSGTCGTCKGKMFLFVKAD